MSENKVMDTGSGLQPHQQRVVAERDALGENIGRLNTFVHAEGFQSIVSDPRERERLLRQFWIMDLYLIVLDERIAAFNKS